MDQESLWQEISRIATSRGWPLRRNRDRVALLFTDQFDEWPGSLSLLASEGCESWMAGFAAIDERRSRILTCLRAKVEADGGTWDSGEGVLSVTTGDGFQVLPTVDRRLTLQVESLEDAQILRNLLVDNWIDKKATKAKAARLLESPDKIRTRKRQKPSFQESVTEGLFPGFQEMASAVTHGLEKAMESGVLGKEFGEGLKQELDTARSEMDQAFLDLQRSFEELSNDLSDPTPEDLEDLFQDFQNRFHARPILTSLPESVDLVSLDRWASRTISDLRGSLRWSLRENPALWVPGVDQWIGQEAWNTLALQEEAKDPSGLPDKCLGYLLRNQPTARLVERTRKWIEGWLASGAYDADCFYPILSPFLAEMPQLEEHFDWSFHTKLLGWLHGDLRWEKVLRDHVLLTGSNACDALVELLPEGEGRDFLDRLFSLEELSQFRSQTLREIPVSDEVAYKLNFGRRVRAALLLGWNDVLEALSDHPILPHALWCHDAPTEVQELSKATLFQGFRAYHQSMESRDHDLDNRTLDRLLAPSEFGPIHFLSVDDAVLACLAPPLRRHLLPLFARAILDHLKRNVDRGDLSDPDRLAIAWVRLRPHCLDSIQPATVSNFDT